MGVVLHWFLPTNGDSRTDLSLGNAVGAAGSRVVEGGTARVPDIGYTGQIARSAEQPGFVGALTPTNSWCEDGWVMGAALSQVAQRFKFLVAFRPAAEAREQAGRLLAGLDPAAATPTRKRRARSARASFPCCDAAA